MSNPSEPAEKIAFWADKLRDLSATGLHYAENGYDKTRYEIIQNMAIEMLAYATDHPVEAFQPLRENVFTHMSPVVAGAAAVIDKEGKILLMRRTDNRLWAMPAGQMEVGETPAEGVVREAYEETGVCCIPKALVGVYDSRIWARHAPHHIYMFCFLCEPIDGHPNSAFDPIETIEIGWFAQGHLPDDLYEGHRRRISDAYKAWEGSFKAHFDRQKE